MLHVNVFLDIVQETDWIGDLTVHGSNMLIKVSSKHSYAFSPTLDSRI